MITVGSVLSTITAFVWVAVVVRMKVLYMVTARLYVPPTAVEGIATLTVAVLVPGVIAVLLETLATLYVAFEIVIVQFNGFGSV